MKEKRSGIRYGVLRKLSSYELWQAIKDNRRGTPPEVQHDEDAPEGFVGLEEAEAMTGLSHLTFLRLCILGRISDAQKIGNKWYILKNHLHSMHFIY